MTGDLAAWLTSVWDEEERLATEAQEECPSLTWEAEKVYDGVYAIALGPSEHPDTDSYDVGDDTRMPREIALHIAYYDPASALARIAADRKILAEHRAEEIVSIEPETRGRAFLVCRRCRTGERQLVWPCTTVRLLAEPYADLEGFRSEWLVERQGVER